MITVDLRYLSSPPLGKAPISWAPAMQSQDHLGDGHAGIVTGRSGGVLAWVEAVLAEQPAEPLDLVAELTDLIGQRSQT